jgi:hypothetical protein
MLLIYPPVARSCEPPPGIARLAGLLRRHGVAVRTLDLCHEGLEFLLRQNVPASDTWTKSALASRQRNGDLLRSAEGYDNMDRYNHAVLDLNRALSRTGKERGISVTLADYQDLKYSPLKRADLLASAVENENNLFHPLFQRRLEETLGSFETGIIGLSVNFLSQALCAFAIIGFLKRAHPEKKIVLGGGLITSWVRQGSLSDADTFGGLVDAVLPGKGEEVLLEYLGLAQTAATAAPDFDDFSVNGYFAPVRIVPYNFTIGCPWKRCTFCPEKAENTPYGGVHPDVAAGEIAQLVKRYSPGLLHFTDNELSAPYLKRLASSPPGTNWYGFARFAKELDDPGFCLRLAASGCVMLQLGLESGDQKVLDALGKGTNIAQIDRILDNLKAASIAVFLYVLFGTPAENRASALATRDFIESRAGLIDFMNLAVFNMPASGEEAKTLKTQAFYEGDLSLYCAFDHPEGWGRGAVRVFLREDFEPSPGVAKILRRNPPVFTSNHAPFFIRSRKENQQAGGR